MMGANTWYVGCTGPVRQGQALKCFVETKTKTQFTVNLGATNIWVSLIDPAVTVANQVNVDLIAVAV